MSREATLGTGNTANSFILSGDNAAQLTLSQGVNVYHRTGTTWTKEAVLNPDSPAEPFGSSMAIDGDTLVIGVRNLFQITYPAITPPVMYSTYVFQRVNGTWVKQAKLLGNDAATDSFLFGQSVAISGNTLAIGAEGARQALCSTTTCVNRDRHGIVYVFQRTGSTWVQTYKLTTSPQGTFDSFGANVALSADLLVVGHDLIFDGSRNQVEVYHCNSGQCLPKAILKPSDLAITGSNTHGVGFGGAFALSGNTLVVGGSADVSGTTVLGSAYAFQNSSGVWKQQAKLTPAIAQTGMDLGGT